MIGGQIVEDSCTEDTALGFTATFVFNLDLIKVVSAVVPSGD